jgi:hypothetical protein
MLIKLYALPIAVCTLHASPTGVTAPDAFAFWRSFSSDQPGREDMDQGGSYQGTKAKK